MIDNETDETITRPMVVLYSIGNAISYSHCARRELLFLLFCIAHDKHLNEGELIYVLVTLVLKLELYGIYYVCLCFFCVGLVYKILNLVRKKLGVDSVKHLIRDNSLYLLWNWFKKYTTFEVLIVISTGEF